jgi:hypothetical protein
MSCVCYTVCLFPFYSVLCCTVLHCTVLHCTVLYCTVLYYTVLYCTTLYCTVLHCTVLYYTVLYCTVLCSKVIPHVSSVSLPPAPQSLPLPSLFQDCDPHSLSISLPTVTLHTDGQVEGRCPEHSWRIPKRRFFHALSLPLRCYFLLSLSSLIFSYLLFSFLIISFLSFSLFLSQSPPFSFYIFFLSVPSNSLSFSVELCAVSSYICSTLFNILQCMQTTTYKPRRVQTMFIRFYN